MHQFLKRAKVTSGDGLVAAVLQLLSLNDPPVVACRRRPTDSFVKEINVFGPAGLLAVGQEAAVFEQV